MKSITEVIAEINAAKLAIKGGAVEARTKAPKGEKMAHGQHFSAENGAKLATASVSIITSQGFVPSAVTPRVSKTGRVEFSVTYRETQTLAQRVQTMVNAAARRKAAREVKAAAKLAATAAKTVAMPNSSATDALAALAKSMPIAA